MSGFLNARYAKFGPDGRHIPWLALVDSLRRSHSVDGFQRPEHLRVYIDHAFRRALSHNDDASCLPCHPYYLDAFRQTDASDCSKADCHSHGRLPCRSEFPRSRASRQNDECTSFDRLSKDDHSHLWFWQPATPNRRLRRLTDQLSTRNVQYIFLRTWLFLSKKVLPARRRLCCSGKTNLALWGAYDTCAGAQCQ
jgi:hypothetical protein